MYYNGSIPACAGEPLATAPKTFPVTVYPRVCGGTDCGLGFLTCENGLSPRVRGNPFRRCHGVYWRLNLSPRVRGNPPLFAASHQGLRSIPACAGEPHHHKAQVSTDAVYPRVCGGTSILAAGVAPEQGLSPRVRGNPRPCGGRGGSATGLSPRVRGNRSSKRTRNPSRLQVYPRVCGGTLGML